MGALAQEYVFVLSFFAILTVNLSNQQIDYCRGRELREIGTKQIPYGNKCPSCRTGPGCLTVVNHAPRFLAAMYSLSMPSKAKPGDVLGRVPAIDRDLCSSVDGALQDCQVIEYSVRGVSGSSNLFSVDPKDASIVRTNETLTDIRYESPIAELQLTARNRGAFRGDFGQTTLVIWLLVDSVVEKSGIPKNCTLGRLETSSEKLLAGLAVKIKLDVCLWWQGETDLTVNFSCPAEGFARFYDKEAVGGNLVFRENQVWITQLTETNVEFQIKKLQVMTTGSEDDNRLAPTFYCMISNFTGVEINKPVSAIAHVATNIEEISVSKSWNRLDTVSLGNLPTDGICMDNESKIICPYEDAEFNFGLLLTKAAKYTVVVEFPKTLNLQITKVAVNVPRNLKINDEATSTKANSTSTSAIISMDMKENYVAYALGVSRSEKLIDVTIYTSNFQSFNPESELHYRLFREDQLIQTKVQLLHPAKDELVNVSVLYGIPTTDGVPRLSTQIVRIICAFPPKFKEHLLRMRFESPLFHQELFMSHFFFVFCGGSAGTAVFKDHSPDLRHKSVTVVLGELLLPDTDGRLGECEWKAYFTVSEKSSCSGHIKMLLLDTNNHSLGGTMFSANCSNQESPVTRSTEMTIHGPVRVLINESAEFTIEVINASSSDTDYTLACDSVPEMPMVLNPSYPKRSIFAYPNPYSKPGICDSGLFLGRIVVPDFKNQTVELHRSIWASLTVIPTSTRSSIYTIGCTLRDGNYHLRKQMHIAVSKSSSSSTYDKYQEVTFVSGLMNLTRDLLNRPIHAGEPVIFAVTAILPGKRAANVNLSIIVRTNSMVTLSMPSFKTFFNTVKSLYPNQQCSQIQNMNSATSVLFTPGTLINSDSKPGTVAFQVILRPTMVYKDFAANIPIDIEIYANVSGQAEYKDTRNFLVDGNDQFHFGLGFEKSELKLRPTTPSPISLLQGQTRWISFDLYIGAKQYISRLTIAIEIDPHDFKEEPVTLLKLHTKRGGNLAGLESESSEANAFSRLDTLQISALEQVIGPVANTGYFYTLKMVPPPDADLIQINITVQGSYSNSAILGSTLGAKLTVNADGFLLQEAITFAFIPSESEDLFVNTRMQTEGHKDTDGMSIGIVIEAHLLNNSKRQCHQMNLWLMHGRALSLTATPLSESALTGQKTKGPFHSGVTLLAKGDLSFDEKIRLSVEAKYQPNLNDAIASDTIHLTTLLTCNISVPENESVTFKGPLYFLETSAVKLSTFGDSSLLVGASGVRSPCLQFKPRRSFLYDTSFIIYCDFIPGLVDPLFGHRECFIAFGAQPRLWKSLGKSVSHILVSVKQGENLIGLDCRTSVLFQSNDYGTNWQPVSKSFYEILIKQSPEFLTWPKPTEIPRAEITPGFSPTECGKQCNRWSAGPWKICYNGIFYEDAMVLKWTNA